MLKPSRSASPAVPSLPSVPSSVPSASADPSELAARIAEELPAPDPAVEVGLAASERWTVDVLPGELPAAPGPDLDLGPESVLLVTGGARGITAEVTKAIATAYRPAWCW